MKARALGIKTILADGTILWFRPRNKRHRFVCSTCKYKGKWTTWTGALRDMEKHGPARRNKQGHGGSVMMRETTLVIPNETRTRIYTLICIPNMPRKR